MTATNSSLATFVRDYEQFRSTVFIGHVRLASRGSYSIQNTHPFTRPFRSRDIVLAHNGTLHGGLSRNGLKFHPVGETDSELTLCFVLTKLSEQRTRFTEYQKIESLLQQINRHGTMNLLFSEGEHLFCYRDQTGCNGMCITLRHAPFRRVRLLDEDWEGHLDMEKESDLKGVIVATSKLTDEEWTDLPIGNLTVFCKGEQVY